jgi:hypothetical protein
MLDTTIVMVAIGLVWMYASVSLIASQINEGVASLLGRRSKDLASAIGNLLNDPDVKGWALKVLNHPLVSPLADGKAQSLAELKNLPSYISADHFAAAVLDGMNSWPGASGTLRENIGRVADPQLRGLLEGILATTQGDVVKVRAELAAWFDGAMDRLSGAYKRRTQLACFCIGLLIAIAFNVDSIRIFQVLWNRPVLMTELTTGAVPVNTQDALTALQSLPIGWPSAPTFEWSIAGALCVGKMLLGWTLTALSVLFGAPFWFDLLQKIAQVRSTGPKPKEV